MRPDWPEGRGRKWIQMGECRSTRKETTCQQVNRQEKENRRKITHLHNEAPLITESVGFRLLLRVADNQFLVCVFYSFISGISRQTAIFFNRKAFPRFLISSTRCLRLT